MTAGAVLGARIDQRTKKRVAEALGAMGLSISDAIRLLMSRLTEEKRLPFVLEVPNAATRRAMAELEAGGGTTYASAAELLDGYQS
ncbi:type II toxin-antitoxin system RelB/DinJ family antitoxin [Acinetobacter baumannii]